MKRIITLTVAILSAVSLLAQKLPVKWEELSAVEFSEAVNQSSKVAIIPMGVLEKHGPQLPLGTDVYTARELSIRAAEIEYAVVFPWYYFGQINEAKHQPGTLSYSPELIWKMLQETLDEIHRNGFDKIILISGHGGNKAFLEYFCQCQLAETRGYSVYWYQQKYNPEMLKKAEALSMHDPNEMHAGNRETSMVKAIVPDRVHTELADSQDASNRKRLSNLSSIYTGIWWYARYPNHYAGDGSKATAEAGEIILESTSEAFAKVIRSVKEDRNVPALTQQFYQEAANPLATPQPYE
ncbi:MAG: creatininase family protein [Bacteroidales bacterium]|nr:creatininase family protein [Candidatus Cacconaster merdequi]